VLLIAYFLIREEIKDPLVVRLLQRAPFFGRLFFFLGDGGRGRGSPPRVKSEDNKWFTIAM
jgi:hypothetical protein